MDVTRCVRLHTLLHVVSCCCAKFETGQTLSYVQIDAKTPNNVACIFTGFFTQTVAKQLYAIDAKRGKRKLYKKLSWILLLLFGLAEF